MGEALMPRRGGSAKVKVCKAGSDGKEWMDVFGVPEHADFCFFRLLSKTNDGSVVTHGYINGYVYIEDPVPVICVSGDGRIETTSWACYDNSHVGVWEPPLCDGSNTITFSSGMDYEFYFIK